MTTTPPLPPDQPRPAGTPAERVISTSIVVGAGSLMLALAVLETLLGHAGALPSACLNIALLAAAAAALTAALYRARHGLRAADAFLSLALLNPFLYTRHIEPLNPTLLGASLLGLVAAAILAMKRDNTLRYGAVLLLTLALSWISDTFLMLLPALVAWFLFAGFTLARRPNPATPASRRRGFLIMALGEIGLVVFGLACILSAPTASPQPASLFSTITSFADFPLLVIAIVLLALGWHKGPHHTTPPYFAGMLALLVGLLTMLLNNFQAGTLPAPGADQSILVLCLLYTVSALHGPRRLQPFIPPILLILAILYTFFR